MVAVFARPLSVPPPSLLVLAGLLAGLPPAMPDITVAADVVSLVVLPPVLSAAAGELSRRDLRAVCGYRLPCWSWGLSWHRRQPQWLRDRRAACEHGFRGAVLASTDPVAVPWAPPVAPSQSAALVQAESDLEHGIDAQPACSSSCAVRARRRA